MLSNANELSRTEVKNEVARAMKARNAVSVEVHFSGGNDEGGVDTIYFVNAEGDREMFKVDWPKYVWESRSYKFQDDQHEQDWRLREVLARPVMDEWGTFAGDFSVDGTVIFNQDGTATMSQNVGYYEYEEQGGDW